jgi:preprotein translocase subunit YajC
MTLNRLHALLAQGGQQAMQQDPTGQMIKFFGMMAIFIVMMWLMIFAPQRKKAKEQERLLNALRAGDKIITASGIIGVVLSVKDKSVSIRSAETKLEVLKSAITDVTEKSGEPAEVKS